jgi:hypothetical protein
MFPPCSTPSSFALSLHLGVPLTAQYLRFRIGKPPEDTLIPDSGNRSVQSVRLRGWDEAAALSRETLSAWMQPLRTRDGFAPFHWSTPWLDPLGHFVPQLPHMCSSSHPYPRVRFSGSPHRDVQVPEGHRLSSSAIRAIGGCRPSLGNVLQAETVVRSRRKMYRR